MGRPRKEPDGSEARESSPRADLPQGWMSECGER